MIVRETEAEARAAADRLVSALDADVRRRHPQPARSTPSLGRRQPARAQLRDGADDDGYAEPNLWTGVGRARSGAGAAIVGDPDQVVAKLEAYRDVGVDAFILSGYTHRAEAELVAEHVLPRLTHAPFKPRFEAASASGA